MAPTGDLSYNIALNHAPPVTAPAQSLYIANTVAEQRRDILCAWGDACGRMVSECNGFRRELLCTFLCDAELKIKEGKQVLAKERGERKKARMREYMKQLRQKKKKERET
jgi:hypothetical protein